MANVCHKKTRYDNKGVAAREAARMGLDYYYCHVCGGCHLTSKNRIWEL